VKIYTRRGDEGQTDLFGGGRVSKHDLRVEAYGAVDELNACVGACVAASSQIDLGAIGRRIQGQLFELGGYLATPDADKRERSSVPEIGAEEVAELEADIDRLEGELEPLRRFIVPGGTAAAASFHLARTVCRRAERRAVALHQQDPLGAAPLRYLNRLSDLLFVMARVENCRDGEPDIEWTGRSR
jgi:cob(I)alamin adenosyltransferase